MESQFGLFNVWAQGDWVTRGVALLLLGMSLASWMVILFKAMDIVRYKKLARQAEGFWHSPDFAEGLRWARPGQPLPHRPRKAAAVAHHAHRRTARQPDINDWVTRCLRNSTTRLAPAGWPGVWPRSAPPHPSSACSARSGASTTRC
jgi:biopolymer transport protein ExbB